MKVTLFIFLMISAWPVLGAVDRLATEATLQAVEADVKQLQSDVQKVNSSVTELRASVENLANDIRNFYGGLEYVLLAIAQAFYFGLGLGLFYVFDRGRIARDIW